jgi:hypothetical protein
MSCRRSRAFYTANFAGYFHCRPFFLHRRLNQPRYCGVIAGAPLLTQSVIGFVQRPVHSLGKECGKRTDIHVHARAFESGHIAVPVLYPYHRPWIATGCEHRVHQEARYATIPVGVWVNISDKSAVCIAYEMVTSNNGALALLTPMSEVAGRLALQVGAHSLAEAQGGRGILLGGVPFAS